MKKVSVERFILMATIIVTVGFIITGLLISTAKQDGVSTSQVDFDNAVYTDDYSDVITKEELILEGMQTTSLSEFVTECTGRCDYPLEVLKVGDYVRIKYSDTTDRVFVTRDLKPQKSSGNWTSLLITE